MLKNGAAYLSYIMYLRKSRQDDPHETVEEVLAKHEAILQEYAERELGGRIPEGSIYREVVSGERIDDRVEIQKVLSLLENPAVEGVLVVEPSRLSRGDLADCSRIIDSFRFTHTLVATPMMTYNLEKKMERKFFQDELLRGNDYLEYTKEILFRGRIAAAKRGCYISAHPPYGYDRVKIGRDWTLTPNDDADAVRLVFKWYTTEGLSPGAIARRLSSMGFAPAQGKKWSRSSVYHILTNIHYVGKIKYNEFKDTWVLSNGKREKKQIRQPDEDVIISEGKHPALVDKATFDAAQERTANNPRLRDDQVLINGLAGILRCSKCGSSMALDRCGNYEKYTPRYKCKKGCISGAAAPQVWDAVLVTLEQGELPELRAKLENGDGDAAAIQKRRIEKLVKQLEDYRDQEDRQYELLETKKYSQAVFDRRNAALREKMEACEKELHLAREALPQNVDYAEKIVMLEDAIESMKNPEVSTKEKNQLLRAIVERIEITTERLGFKDVRIYLEAFLRL